MEVNLRRQKKRILTHSAVFRLREGRLRWDKEVKTQQRGKETPREREKDWKKVVDPGDEGQGKRTRGQEHKVGKIWGKGIFERKLP